MASSTVHISCLDSLNLARANVLCPCRVKTVNDTVESCLDAKKRERSLGSEPEVLVLVYYSG